MATGTLIGVSQTQRLRLTVGLQTSLQVLHADASGLARYLEDQAAEIPALVVKPNIPVAGDWLPRWTGSLPHAKAASADRQIAAPEASMIAHVLSEIDRIIPASDMRIAIALSEALEPTGWLGRTLEQIAADLGVKAAEVEAVLVRLQTLEPAGLFARDLAECIRLQAADAGCLDDVMTAMLGRLDLVASGNWGALARLVSVTQDEVIARFVTIRSFNPKPGTLFSAVASPLREPDLTVREGADGWEVALNHSSLPTLAVTSGASGAGRAREVIALVENRNATLIAVARAVLVHQRAALEQGTVMLRPLTMQTVAEAVGIHKSTVSRVVAGTAIDTPHGTWWLRALFSADMGGDAGAAALRARLARLISAENRAAPLTDEALAQALCGAGPAIARRTVAKYRADLRIPPAHRRRVRS